MAFSSTLELAQLTEKELGHNVTTSSQRTDIVSHLDEAHKVILAGGGILNYDENGKRIREDVTFVFAKSQNPKILELLPAIKIITVTATRGSTSITFSGDPNSGTSVQDYFIRTKNEEELYRIASHTASSSSATLDGAYVGAANLSAAACEIFPLRYQIGSSDILQLISPLRSYNSGSQQQDHIDVIDEDELIDNFPLRRVGERFPECAAVIKESSGNVTVQMNSYPDNIKRVEAPYIPIPTALDTTSSNPIIPAQYRKVLSYLAASYMATRNGDTRAPGFLQTARMLFIELVKWNERLTSSGDPNFGRIIIRGFERTHKTRLGVQKSFT